MKAGFPFVSRLHSTYVREKKTADGWPRIRDKFVTGRVEKYRHSVLSLNRLHYFLVICADARYEAISFSSDSTRVEITPGSHSLFVFV